MISDALDQAEAAASAGAQLVEWRLDDLAEEPGATAATLRLVADSPLPSIVTCRPTAEGGRYEGTEPARVELFEQLLGAARPPRYLDIEWSTLADQATADAIQAALDRQSAGAGLASSVIVSLHDFEGRPAGLLRRVAEMSEHPLCSVIKIAWAARSLRDNLEAFELLAARHQPTIALCMGPLGLPSRVLAGKFGGLLTFAAGVDGEPTAPGQPTVDLLMNQYRFASIGPSTKVYGVVGWPVEHSRGPALHNARFGAVNHDGVYLPLPVAPEYESFKATLATMLDAHGLDLRGLSVTLPHKENLVRFVRERGGRLDGLSERCGAANTLVVDADGGIECLNTDGPAAVDAWCEATGNDRAALRGVSVAILGAGGVACALAAAFAEAGADVVIFNRGADRARRLVSQLGADGVRIGEPQELAGGGFDLIINGTPVGMEGGPAPDASPLAMLAEGFVELNSATTVFDTVYAPRTTPLLRDAADAGATTIDGESMFLRQAALQFEAWVGSERS